jgi:hypothetical protein
MLVRAERAANRREANETFCVRFGNHYASVGIAASGVAQELKSAIGAMIQVNTGAELAGRFALSGGPGEYRLDSDGARLSRHHSAAGAVQELIHEIIRRFIQVRPDLLWIHAGAVHREGRAVMLAGASGRGKSPLVTSLCARGWAYLSDEIVPLDPHTGRILPFPLAPRLRKNLANASAPLQASAGKARVQLPPESISHRTAILAALLFPYYRPDAKAEALHCPPAAAVLELMQNSMKEAPGQDAEIRAFGALVARVPCFRLSFGSAERAAAMIAALDTRMLT